ncbi:MAG: enoyl-CoA hydratase [Burkholderiales bacterium PBB5]|nr:MAG: enoyl-CoA hydratase [Burkholderiales bacterium PBB5]
MNPPAAAPVHTTVDAAGIAPLTIRGAKSLNIIGTTHILAVPEAMHQLATNPAVRVLVLRGPDDRAFVGGADINEMAALNPATAEVFITGLKNLCEAARLFPTPVIARLGGWCLGGGLELAMACDLRLASHDAQLGMPEVKVGIPSVIHAALLRRLVGEAQATWMLLTGDTLDAATALRHGLVHRVSAPGELDADVGRTARQIAELGPQVMRQQKVLMRQWIELPFEDALAASVKAFGQAFTTGEPQRYMQHFFDRKRGG